MQPNTVERPIYIYDAPESILRRLRTLAVCAVASIGLAVTAIFLARPLILFAVPATVVSLWLLAGTSIRWVRRTKPVITMTAKGLQIRTFASGVIPWRVVKSATLFNRFTQATQLAIVFKGDKVRVVTDRRDDVLEAKLPVSEYQVDPAELEATIRERINRAETSPAPEKPVAINVFDPVWFSVVSASLLLVPLSGFAALVAQLKDDPLRERIAAPKYNLSDPSRRLSALSDIHRYPRDTRVRLIYGSTLEKQGRLVEAEKELTGALADTEAIRAISVYTDRRRRAGPSLDEQIRIVLSSVLGEQGKTREAKDRMAGLCRYVPDADMPKFIKLGLCRYE